MTKQYFRVLNESEEPLGVILDSKHKSSFRQEVFAYKDLSHDIYIFAMKTGIQINNAVRVAINVPAFLDILTPFFMSNEEEFPLINLAVDDPIETVNADQFYAFVDNYISHINETNLYYDWGKDHYLWEFIWEMTRNFEFPHLPSRMDSTFLFTEKDQANNFLAEYRDMTYKTVEIELLNGHSEEFDMNWFTDVPANIPISEAVEYARSYWRQASTANPNKETLYIGQYRWIK